MGHLGRIAALLALSMSLAACKEEKPDNPLKVPPTTKTAKTYEEYKEAKKIEDKLTPQQKCTRELASDRVAVESCKKESPLKDCGEAALKKKWGETKAEQLDVCRKKRAY